MSTRATYSFAAGNFTPKATLYLHYDGYPAGAAWYFWNALHCDNARGGLACMMLRANSVAELTHSHESHGDTEYRYSVTGSGPTADLLAHERVWVDEPKINGREDWRVFFTGSVKDFIDQHHTADLIPDYTPFVAVKLNEYSGETWVTPVIARKILADKLRLISTCRGHLDNPNVTSALKIADLLQPIAGHFELTVAAE